MTSPRPALEIRPFQAGDLPEAGALLADRHRRHRLAEPALDPAYEDPAAAGAQIEALLGNETSSGWTALRDGAIDGYLIGVRRDDGVWGPNIWVEPAGHAASSAEVLRRLYATAAETWVADGRTNHHALMPATDTELVDAWFSLDFGQQHLHAVVEAPPASFGVVPRSELTIRRATLDDVGALVGLERVLPDHLEASPVFSRLPRQSPDEVIAELESDLGDPDYTYLVAEHEGTVVGSAIACALTMSPGATGLNRPPNAGYLGYAAVLPEARGLGVGRALGESVLVWSRDAGFTCIATDWRSTNLEADQTWRGMGFRPTFRRLHRVIA